MRPSLFLAAMLVSAAALAQYPSRPVKILVTIPPGGTPDLVARVIADKISPKLGQPVIVENKPAANGNVAADEVGHAPADGHTLLLAADSLITVNPHVYTKMPVDTLKDLTPIAPLVWNQSVFSINPALPPKTFPEFIEYARKARPPLAYASGGAGSLHQLVMEMLKARAGIDLVHVPYRGGTQAATATMSGEVAAMLSGTSSAPQIRAGRLRALAVAGATRSPIFPDLPTIGEFYPGFESTNWVGMFGPAGMPAEVLKRLRIELQAALDAPDVKEKLRGTGGLERLDLSPEKFEALIRRDYERYGELVRKLGIKAD